MPHHQITILGAGLQGLCAALALRQKGYRIQLIEQTPEPMLRSSLRNEGKIHLGFVYANDQSDRTSLLMLESALAFAPLIDDWTGRAIDWDELRSPCFDYLVLSESLLRTEQLFEHYERVNQTYLLLRGPSTSYLGTRPESLSKTTIGCSSRRPASMYGSFPRTIAFSPARLRQPSRFWSPARIWSWSPAQST